MYVEDEQEDNRNVYALIDEYYSEHEQAEEIMPKKTVETFMRKMLWAGESQEELKEMWPVIKLVLHYVEKDEIGYIERLTVYDYLYLIWRAGNGKLGDTIYLLTEENVNYFADVLRKFYDFLTDEAQPNEHKLPYMVELFRKYVYVMGKFDYPEIDPNDDHFDLLMRVEELAPEEGEEINEHIDDLMERASEYFRVEKFELDIGRALRLYADGIYPLDEQNTQDFGFGFWDYFMFDYHLLHTDLTPLEYYYKKERGRLSASEKMILREMLSAKFQVFEIVDVDEDNEMLCKNLFSDEMFTIPYNTIQCDDIKNTILCSHSYSSCIVMMNNICQYPASPKLRARIKSEIEYHLEMYRCQRPKATIEDFIARHSIAVRHIVEIFTTRAQLGIAPVRQLPAPVKKRNRSFMSREEKNDYLNFLNNLLSRHSCFLTWDLYCDAAAAGTLAVWGKTSIQSKCAVALVFMRINMFPDELEDDVCKIFGVSPLDAKQLADWIAGDLALTEADPRYLAEEGYKYSILAQM